MTSKGTNLQSINEKKWFVLLQLCSVETLENKHDYLHFCYLITISKKGDMIAEKDYNGEGFEKENERKS